LYKGHYERIRRESNIYHLGCGAQTARKRAVEVNGIGLVAQVVADVMIERRMPEHIRSDNGAEMTAKIVRNWFAKLGSKTLYIAPGSYGRMATASPSTASYGTNASTAKSSTA
jgi:hypothetical protein